MGMVLTTEELIEKAAAHKRAGERVALVAGAFDLLHPGHLEYLANAQTCGGILIVLVEDDEGVRRKKGSGRPIMPERERAELVAALACVDYVVIAKEGSREEIIRRIGADRDAKSARRTGEGAAEPGGRRYSTTLLIERARKAKSPEGMAAGASPRQNRKE
jgi:rfaE bifunctional protein nucleotidyltransferase chain/domain